MAHLEVVAVKFCEQLAVLTDGSLSYFANMFNMDGEDTNDVDEAVTALVPLPDGRWEVIQFEDFERVNLH